MCYPLLSVRGLSESSAWAGYSFAIAQKTPSLKAAFCRQNAQLRHIADPDMTRFWICSVMVGAMVPCQRLTCEGHHRDQHLPRGDWPGVTNEISYQLRLREGALWFSLNPVNLPSGPSWMVGSRFDPGWSRHGHHPREDRQGYEHRCETTRCLPSKTLINNTPAIPQYLWPRLKSISPSWSTMMPQRSNHWRSSAKDQSNLEALLDQPPQDCPAGKILREGISTANSSNVQTLYKSSSPQANLLSRRKKAIVTDRSAYHPWRYRGIIRQHQTVPPNYRDSWYSERPKTSLSNRCRTAEKALKEAD